MGLGGTILGAILGGRGEKWQKEGMMNILNTLNAGNQYGLGRAQESGDPSRQASLGMLERALQMAFGNEGSGGAVTNFNDAVQQVFSGLNPGAFQQNGLNPEMQALMAAMGGSAGNIGEMLPALLAAVQGGGRTADSGTLRDRMFDVANGQGAQIGTLGDVGMDLLGRRGATGFTANAQDNAGRVISQEGANPALSSALQSIFGITGAGGATPGTQSGIGAALNLILNGGRTANGNTLSSVGANVLGQNGLTPTGAMGESVALENLMKGGRTDATDFLQGRGQELAGREALLPFRNAVNMAQENAGSQVMNAARKAREMAGARGGAAATGVMNGAGNEALADWAGGGAEAVAKAGRDAMLNQQGLQLQERGQGADMVGTGADLERQRLSEAGGLLQGLEGVATNRFGIGGGFLSDADRTAAAREATGFQGLGNLSGIETQRLLEAIGMIPGVSNAEMNRVGTMGGLGMDAGRLELGNMGAGTDMLNAYNGTRQGGMNSLMSLLGMEGGQMLGAGNLFNSGNAGQANILNSILNGQFNAGDLGLNRTNSYYNAANGLFGAMNNNAGNALNMYEMGMNPLLNLANAGYDYAKVGLGSIPGVFSGYRPENAVGGALTNMYKTPIKK